MREECAHYHHLNLLLLLLLPLPSLLFHLAFLRSTLAFPHTPSPSTACWTRICNWGALHPIGLLNILFFLNVVLLFWIVSLLQRSTWLIDPYWTILPLMMAHYFATHPSSHSDPVRSRVVLMLTWAWSIRLTHSYCRRENWKCGAREDWRFAKMRKENPIHWWWMSFFMVYASQQVFLVGICMPIYTVYNSRIPWNIGDTFATVVCISGIIVAYFADTQLHDFCSKNEILKDTGVRKVPVLDRGLWRYSRHPNYFGEQLWWWGLAFYSWNVGQGWATAGTVINSACLAAVTVMVEKRMLANESRAELYREYQKTTSVWIPWFKFKPKALGSKNISCSITNLNIASVSTDRK